MLHNYITTLHNYITTLHNYITTLHNHITTLHNYITTLHNYSTTHGTQNIKLLNIIWVYVTSVIFKFNILTYKCPQ